MKTELKSVVTALTMLVGVTWWAGSARATTIAEWRFDQTNSYTVINEIAGGDQPEMQQWGVGYKNLHAPGGPFPESVGLMTMPNDGFNNVAATSTAALDWSTKSGLTIEMWINPSVSKNPETVFFYRGQIIRLGGTQMDALVYTASGYNAVGWGAPLINIGEWTHIALTYDGTTANTYVNGGLYKTAAFNSPLSNSGNYLTIGNEQGLQWFLGSVDEIRVSDVALLPGNGTGIGELAWNASLILQVPEPTMLALLGLGGLLVFRRRRQME